MLSDATSSKGFVATCKPYHIMKQQGLESESTKESDRS